MFTIQNQTGTLYIHIMYRRGMESFLVKVLLHSGCTLIQLQECHDNIGCTHRAGHPDPHAFYTNVGYVFTQGICLTFYQHKVRKKCEANLF